MCGRYSLSKIRKQVENHFEAVGDDELQVTYNIAPTQNAAVITAENPKAIENFRWGLIPSWAEDMKLGAKMINARLESIREKPAYGPLLEKCRCIIPADGYYEWKKAGKALIPYRMCLPDEGLFAFAGLWDEWRDKNGNHLKTFTVITLPSHTALAHIHPRMPAILPPGKEKLWLSGQVSPTSLLELLHPYPAEQLNVYTVSNAVNSAGANGPELVKPQNYAEPRVQGDLFG